MAIGTTPFFDRISGDVGPLNFRTRRNNEIEISTSRAPAPYTRSAAQQDTNTKYADAVQTWHDATNDQRAAWDALGDPENISGFNWLVREKIKPKKARYGTAKYGTGKYSI